MYVRKFEFPHKIWPDFIHSTLSGYYEVQPSSKISPVPQAQIISKLLFIGILYMLHSDCYYALRKMHIAVSFVTVTP